MERTTRSRSRIAYIVSALCLAALVIGSWILADGVAMKLHVELAEANRALQVDLARNAMEESFLRVLEENRILASYSFPEFIAGARDSASMASLLRFEIESYKESIAYSFYEKPGTPRFLAARPGSEAVVAAMDSASAKVWGHFPGGDIPEVLPGSASYPEPFFMVFYPVIVDGAMSGLLGTAVGFGKTIDKYLSPLASTDGSRAFLRANESVILWTSDKAAPAAEKDDLITRGSFRLGAMTVHIVGIESRSSLLAEFQAISAPRIVAIFASFIVSIGALFAANRIYLDGKRRVAAEAEKMRLAEGIAKREEELRQSEIRYGKLFSEAGDGILILDESGRVIECNARAVSLFMYPMDEIIGKRPSELSPPVQPDGRPSDVAVSATMAAVRSAGSQLFDWVHRRRDGSLFYAEVSMAILRIGFHEHFQAFIRDVTPRKADEAILHDALEEREVILRELQHSVKNNFQFLDSLIELQKGDASEEARKALAKIQSRISALATAYLLMAENPDSLRVDMGEFLQRLSSHTVETLGLENRPELELSCDDISLSLDVAVSLGLLLRELLTNAAQYGCSDTAGGRIEARFVRDGNSAVLSVRDFGGGISADHREYLGFSIIRALVQQIRGSLSLEPAVPGTIAEIRFPLA